MHRWQKPSTIQLCTHAIQYLRIHVLHTFSARSARHCMHVDMARRRKPLREGAKRTRRGIREVYTWTPILMLDPCTVHADREPRPGDPYRLVFENPQNKWNCQFNVEVLMWVPVRPVETA